MQLYFITSGYYNFIINFVFQTCRGICMYKLSLMFLLLQVATSSLKAQHTYVAKGKLIDTSGKPLPKIALQFVQGFDTLHYTSTDNGNFYFNNVRAGIFLLTIAMPGQPALEATYSIPEDTGKIFNIPSVTINGSIITLQETIVRPLSVIIKEDTIQYNAAAFKMRDGALIEDLIKKFPGIAIDKDGNITIQGKLIEKVRVNGKDFFAGDVRSATQNLPAEIISNIQIIDDYGDQANITGIKTGASQKIININTRKDKNKGSFGNITLGIGDDGRYIGSTSLNNFKDERQIALLASINNTSVNPSGFNFSPNSPGASAGAGTAQAGSGITTTKSLGINFRNKWSEKLSVYGSYSFSGRSNYIESTVYQQDFNPLDTRTTDRTGITTTKTDNHRLNWNMEYAIDTDNFFKLALSASFNQNIIENNNISLLSRVRFFTNSRNQLHASGNNINLNGNISYNRRFKKRGRNFNINATIDNSAPKQQNEVINLYTDVDSAGLDSPGTTPLITNLNQHQSQNDDNSSIRSSFNISYIEPLYKYISVEFNYAYDRSKITNQHDVSDIDSLRFEQFNTSLTNHYSTTFITDKYGINIQSAVNKYKYVIGVVVQPSNMQGFNETRNLWTSYKTVNWSPNARFFYRISSLQSITLSYSGNSRAPDFQKLQPFIDSENLSNIIIGNPDLQAEFVNRLNASYNSFDKASGNTLFVNLSYDHDSNKIVSSIMNDANSTSRTTTYVNTDGSYNMAGNASLSKPFNSRKYTAAINIFGNLNNNISYADNEKINGQYWMLRPGAKVRIDLPDLLDAELFADFAVNHTRSDFPDHVMTAQTQTIFMGLNGKVYFLKNMTFGYDYSRAFNFGYGGNINTNPDILSIFVEYRFLKRKIATLRLQGFDLLNQNTRITRSIYGTTVTDSRSNGLLRYFFLTFNLRFNKFSK